MIPVALAKAMLQKNRTIPSAPVQGFAFSSVHRHFQSVRCFARAIVTPNMIGHYWRSISS